MIDRKWVIPAIAGFVLALALAMGRLTRPEVILGWLDITGDWDPTMIIFSMSGALTYAVLARRAGVVPKPGGRVDLRLAIGAAIFGVGWAMAGVCPGPAFASMGAGAPWALVFVAAMAVGIRAGDYVTR